MTKVVVKGIVTIVFCSVLLIALALNSVTLATSLQPANSHLETSVQPMSAVFSSNWHEGTNQSTPELNVSYTEEYGRRTGYDTLNRKMYLPYNDGTKEKITVVQCLCFNPGGVDISHQQVLDWSKLDHVEIGLGTEGSVNGTSLETGYIFTGFSIISGAAKDFTLSKIYQGNGTYYYAINNVVGIIQYWESTAYKISTVTLSTVNAIYNGKVMTESVVKFNVTIGAQIIACQKTGTVGVQLAGTAPQNQTLNVPVVLMFQVTHDTAHTEYKYGVDIDWSIRKDFPATFEINHVVYSALQNGDNFSLIAQDYLSFYGPNAAVKSFSTDAKNDSAIYLVNGTELCRELFTTNYTINGSPQIYNTTRIYIPDAIHQVGNNSAVFVCFGGFKYNQSSGFTFDPAVITPNSIRASNALTVIIPLSAAIVVIAAAAIAIVFRRHQRASKTLKETSIRCKTAVFPKLANVVKSAYRRKPSY